MSDDKDPSSNGEINGDGGDKMVNGRTNQVNRYLEVLTDSRRRHALYYLNEHRGEVTTIDELARQVKVFESEYSVDTLVKDEYADVRRELYHKHLPQLADYGIINYDSRSGDIRVNHLSRLLLILLRVSHLIEPR